MYNEIEVYKMAITGNEKENKLFDGLEISLKVFISVIIYTTLNVIAEIILSNKWGEFVPLLTYPLLLLGMSGLILRYRQQCKGRFKLLEDEMIEIIKIVLIVNGTYFVGIGLQEAGIGGYAMAVTNFSLYLGFVISLNDLINAKTWKNIYRCFLNVFPKKQFAILMVVLAVLFGIIGFYSQKESVLVGMFVVLGFVILLFFLICALGKKQINSMCKKIVLMNNKKRMLILHVGSNLAILNKVKKEMKNLREVDLLNQNDNDGNKYDIILVLNTSYGEDGKNIVYDIIGRALKINGIIIDPFVSTNKKRKRLWACFGMPGCLTQFDSIDEYKNVG